MRIRPKDLEELFYYVFVGAFILVVLGITALGVVQLLKSASCVSKCSLVGRDDTEQFDGACYCSYPDGWHRLDE